MNVTLCNAVLHGRRAYCWNTTPLSRPGPVIGLPSIVHVPSSGWDKPARISSNVVFPQPLGPNMTRNSPLLMDKFTPPKA